MAQKIPDSLIDEILASAKKYNLETGETFPDEKEEKTTIETTEAVEETVVEETAEAEAVEEVVEEKTEEPKKKRFSLNFSSLVSKVYDEDEDDEYEDISSSEVTLSATENGQISFTTDGEEIGNL